MSIANEEQIIGRLGGLGLECRVPAEGRQAWQERFNSGPGADHFGGRLDLSDSRVLRLYLDEIQDHHRGGLGTPAVNGAVLAALFDIALGGAGAMQFIDRHSGTIDLSLKYMQPTTGPEVALYAIVKVRRTNVAFVEAELYDSTNGLTAVGQGIVAASATLGKKIKGKR